MRVKEFDSSRSPRSRGRITTPRVCRNFFSVSVLLQSVEVRVIFLLTPLAVAPGGDSKTTMPDSSELVIRETPLDVKPAPAATAPPAAAAAGPPARHGPPPHLPIILAIVLPLVYALLAAPLFQSAANPDTNIPRLPVLVCSLDTPSGAVDVGGKFTAFFTANKGGSQLVTNNGALSLTLPGIQLVQASQYSAADLVDQVKSSQVYAAVFVNAGASAALAAALASPAAAIAYDPSTAVTIVWDEARNNVVSTARIGGPLKGLLGAFGSMMSKVTLGTWLAMGEPNKSAFASGANAQVQMAALTSVLSNPVGYSEVSLYPFTVPALNQALTVGQILLCVFALIITNVTFGPVNFIPFIRSASPGVGLALRRLAVIMLLSCMTGVAFATILVGIANQTNISKNAQNLAPGVSYGAVNAVGFFSGTQWAQVWATQWLETSIFAIYLCIAVTLAGNPAVAGALLGPMIIFNSVAISVDTSDVGFQFFYYAPMWHSSELVRTILFGTLSSRVSMHVGVHFLWFLVEVALFFAAHHVVARRAAAAAAAKETAAAAEAAATAAAAAPSQAAVVDAPSAEASK